MISSRKVRIQQKAKLLFAHPTIRKDTMTKKSLSEKRFEKDFIQLKKLLMAMEHRVGNILEHSESVAIMAAVIARKNGF